MGAAAVPSTAAGAFPQSPPDDPLFDASPLPNATNEQWDLASPSAGFDRGISADRAWALSTGAGVTIADVDVGVQLDHPDLAGRWAVNPGESGRDSSGRDRAANGVDDDRNGYVDDWRGWDFYGYDNNPTSDTSNAHGTNVAGVLGAAAANGIGVAGVAPNSRLLPLRTADNILHQGVRVGEAIVYATDRGASAISMSLGADSFSTPLRRAVRYAHRRGAVPVVAIGNEFHFHHHYPQVMDEALAVGGINPDTANLAARDQRLAQVASDFTVHASYSDYGAHLDVVAPTQVETTEWGGGYRNVWDGTSAATPHVAAVVGLVAARAKALELDLSAGELIQIVRTSADDLTDAGHGYAPGWDRLSGWGRVNAFAAVSRAAVGKIPPVADIRSPSWYQPRRGRFAVRGTVTGRAATSWTLELGAGEQPDSWREIARGGATAQGAPRQLAKAKPHALARLDARRLDAGPWTLRLRATDAQGNSGEDRALFHSMRDPALRRGYPRSIGDTSGEASPTLADVNGDRRTDIVLPTAGGKVHVWSGRRRRELRGWPRKMRVSQGSGPTARRIGAVRSGFLATAAVGDIAGGRRPEVVAAGLDGRLYAWTARGRRVRGFPFRIALRRTAEKGRLDGAIYATPALADLDRDGKLDVVFGAADQRIYAVKGNGRPVPGWPVLARDTGADVAKILSSPAIGDLNGDGSPDVVEGTAESYGSTPDMSGRVHAFDARGRPLPGWPVGPPGLAVNSIPLAGQGVPMSPVLADVDADGRDEVAVASFTGEPELYRGDGSRMDGAGGQSHFQFSGTGAGSKATSPSVLALGANAAFGRLASGGPLRLFGGVVDSRLAAAQGSPGTKVDFQHLVGGWDAAGGSWAPSFPIPIEGWQIPSAPAVGDVDGDGGSEVIAGSSGDVLHAFRADGSEPPGWPKDTGGWLLASPAVGDVDGDGRSEVVAVTRDGFLYVWDTPAPVAGAREWPSFRHDARNSGRYGSAP
ncbi:MAG TPA: S8 family serine peptidase [Thermoleophilaceae bacterium]